MYTRNEDSRSNNREKNKSSNKPRKLRFSTNCLLFPTVVDYKGILLLIRTINSIYIY